CPRQGGEYHSFTPRPLRIRQFAIRSRCPLVTRPAPALLPGLPGERWTRSGAAVPNPCQPVRAHALPAAGRNFVIRLKEAFGRREDCACRRAPDTLVPRR